MVHISQALAELLRARPPAAAAIQADRLRRRLEDRRARQTVRPGVKAAAVATK